MGDQFSQLPSDCFQFLLGILHGSLNKIDGKPQVIYLLSTFQDRLFPVDAQTRRLQILQHHFQFSLQTFGIRVDKEDVVEVDPH